MQSWPYQHDSPQERTSAAHRPCTHCRQDVTDRRPELYNEDPALPVFCCFGCKTVYELLTANGLDHYYTLRKDQSFSLKPGRPVSDSQYRYLDDPEFRGKFAKQADDAGGFSMDYYVEGIHCAACLWLIERLPQLSPDVASASLDMGRSVVRITLKHGGSFAQAAKTLDELGYPPHPIEQDEEGDRLLKKENRTWLLRVGIAAACTGNIMLMTVPLYAGLTGTFAAWFRWVNLALYLPVFFFSAVPFYKNAWISLRARTLSIDVPIVLAILLGSLVSFFNLIRGSEHLYFDSLASLVFLLLSSRYLLRRIQQKSLGSSHLYYFLAPSRAMRVEPESGVKTEVSVERLQPGDMIEVDCDQSLPVDGVIVEGASSINAALLTGESLPQRVGPNAAVYAGTVNMEASLRIRVSATGRGTKLGRILQAIEEGSLKKAPVVLAADRISRWFLAAVLAGSAGVLLFSPSWSAGINRALALIIVTCPCALALATPLSMILSLGKAARRGILIKGSEVLEKIARARNIILDKTGTLTHGLFEVREVSVQREGFDPAPVVIALESRSKHPVARALVKYFTRDKLHTILPIANYKEILGQGVQGEIQDHFYEIKSFSSEEEPLTTLGVFQDSYLIAKISLGDQIREEARPSLERLRELGLFPSILSGDDSKVVACVAREVGIEDSHAFGKMGPEEKKDFVTGRAGSIMVGDGANDALALATSDIGVAVHGSMEVSFRSSDVFLSRPGLKSVVELVEMARETMKVIYRNFGFSLLYNLIGGLGAATGKIHPLAAAILMPVSAFTVLGSAQWGTRRLRKIMDAKDAA